MRQPELGSRGATNEFSRVVGLALDPTADFATCDIGVRGRDPALHLRIPGALDRSQAKLEVLDHLTDSRKPALTQPAR